MLTRQCVHRSNAVRCTKTNPRALAQFEPLGLLTIAFKHAPTFHWRIEYLQGSAAGVDLVVMREIGKPLKDAEQLFVPAAAPDLDVAGAALRTERPKPRDLIA